MKKTLVSFSLLLAAAGASVAAQAGSDSGLYIGGSIGQSSIDAGNDIFSFDEDATGYKMLVGYNFGLVPLVDVAVEADYRDFGNFDSNGIETDASSFDVYGIAGLNFGLFGIFGKLGYADTDVEAELGDFNFDASDSTTSYGLGAKIHLASFAIRAEYEVFDTDDVDDLTMTSVGATITF